MSFKAKPIFATDGQFDEATGALLVSDDGQVGAGGYLSEPGEATQTAGDDASHTMTIPAGTTHCRIAAIGGPLHWNIRGAAADATDSPVDDGASEYVPVKQGTTSLRLFVPTGTTATVGYFAMNAR